MTGYLDNAATTAPCEACVAAVTQMLACDFGNPSSLHGVGITARRAVEQARAVIAESLGAEDKSEICFTSGGTEANNLAVLGTAYANRRKGNRIVITAIEHESVLESALELEKQGFEVICLLPDCFGHITPAQLEAVINPGTILVSMMLVNNEVGSILPVEAVKKIMRRVGAPGVLHIDAVQAYGKMPVRVKTIGADLVSVTAHKIHGPKGVGALYVKKGTHIQPRTFGGEQERKLRPGTESAPLIAGFGAAVADLPNCKEAAAHTAQLKAYLAERLQALPQVEMNSPADGSPYLLNLSVKGYRSQTVIQDLSEMGIFVSNGSACAKGKKSHVLTAMGLPAERIDSAVRVSLSHRSTREEADAFVVALQTTIERRAHT